MSINNVGTIGRLINYHFRDFSRRFFGLDGALGEKKECGRKPLSYLLESEYCKGPRGGCGYT